MYVIYEMVFYPEDTNKRSVKLLVKLLKFLHNAEIFKNSISLECDFNYDEINFSVPRNTIEKQQ